MLWLWRRVVIGDFFEVFCFMFIWLLIVRKVLDMCIRVICSIYGWLVGGELGIFRKVLKVVIVVLGS